MANNEKTSKSIGKLASKALRTPGSLTNKQIQKLGGSALTQRPNNAKSSSSKSSSGKRK